MVASWTTMLAKQDITRNQYTDPLLPGNLGNMDYNPYVEYLKDLPTFQTCIIS